MVVTAERIVKMNKSIEDDIESKKKEKEEKKDK